MKSLILSVLILFAFSAHADELSIIKSSTDSSRWDTTVSQDNRLQYNFGDDRYFYLAIEQMHEAPYYNGVTFNMFGGGFGRNIKLTNDIALFCQVGFLYVKNNTGEQSYNENIEYYMINRFNSGIWKNFTGFRVDNNNAIEATVGLKIKMTNSIDFQMAYSTQQMWTNYVAYLNVDHSQYWHDPLTTHYNKIMFGVGVHF